MRKSDATLNYIRERFAPEDSVLQRIRERLQAHSPQLSGIQLSAAEAKLLQFLIRSLNIKTIVEIGSLAGYSAVWMARALPAGGILHAINKDPEHDAMLRQAVQESGLPIQPHLGEANTILPGLADQAPFDMVFIDADKGGYADYLDWAEQHIRKGGLIVGDNTLLFGHVVHDEKPEAAGWKAWHSMRQFNQRLADPARYDATLIPTPEGMTIARKLF